MPPLCTQIPLPGLCNVLSSPRKPRYPRLSRQPSTGFGIERNEYQPDVCDEIKSSKVHEFRRIERTSGDQLTDPHPWKLRRAQKDHGRLRFVQNPPLIRPSSAFVFDNSSFQSTRFTENSLAGEPEILRTSMPINAIRNPTRNLINTH